MISSFDAYRLGQNQFLIESLVNWFLIHQFYWILLFWNLLSSHNQSAYEILHWQFWIRSVPPFYWMLCSNFVRTKAYLFSTGHFQLFQSIEHKIYRTFHNCLIFRLETRLFVSFDPCILDFPISAFEFQVTHFQSQNFQIGPKDFHGNFENLAVVTYSHFQSFFQFLDN